MDSQAYPQIRHGASPKKTCHTLTKMFNSSKFVNHKGMIVHLK
jgi:hypothetical protein